MNISNKKVGVIITGGIAAYKITELVRSLVKSGAQVRVMMSRAACQFIAPLTLQILSKQEVLVDLFEESDAEHVKHIAYADWCDYVVLAPATANILGKLVNGIADDLVSTALLAVHCPVLIVPAMNHHMYNHPAVKQNIHRLQSYGYRVMPAAYGYLAEGYEGQGRMPEVSVILAELKLLIAQTECPQLLKGKKVLVTAGGTVERIDPVRFISNDSSGKMGYAMALVARYLGAEVQFITSKEGFFMLPGMTEIQVHSAQDMYEAVEQAFDGCDYLVMAAAVSDYRVKEPALNKIKKTTTNQELTIELTTNPDIVATMSAKKTSQCVIGFAAESEHLMAYAKDKLARKNLDWVIANDISQANLGFNVDENQAVLIGSNGSEQVFERMTKSNLAFELWQAILTSQVRGEGVHGVSGK